MLMVTELRGSVSTTPITPVDPDALCDSPAAVAGVAAAKQRCVRLRRDRELELSLDAPAIERRRCQQGAPAMNSKVTVALRLPGFDADVGVQPVLTGHQRNQVRRLAATWSAVLRIITI